MVSLPLIILNSPAISDVPKGGSNPAFGTSRDIAGIVLWVLGLAIEATADVQKVPLFAHFSCQFNRILVPVSLQIFQLEPQG